MNPTQVVPYQTASFYADCLAYEHAIPTLAIPNTEFIDNSDVPWIFKPRSQRDIKTLFLEYMCEGFDIASTISNGLWHSVLFKYDWLIAPREEYKGFEVVKVDCLCLA